MFHDKEGRKMEKRSKIQASIFFGSGILLLLLTIGSGMTPAWAERIISGTITDPWGRPASGYLIKAWDEDGGSKNDFMKQAQTDSQGRYTIGPYEKKHWDTALPGSDKWRPDIFIEVYANIKNRWVKVKQSKTYSDRKHTEDTRIDLQLTGIMGRIQYEKTGKPASGVLVRAWDEDDLVGGNRDYMNQAYTDPQGRYLILYGAKHWDTAAHGVTAWRPDIFIEAYDTIRGRMIKVNKKSKTYENHPIKDNLTIDQTILLKEYMNYSVPKSPDNSLNVLAYNIKMFPHIPNVNVKYTFGQSERYPHIAKQIVGVGDDYDVIVFTEAFDDLIREKLIKLLGYPYKTRIFGKMHPPVPSYKQYKHHGGIIILSRWPIENGEGEYRLFEVCSDIKDDDCFADKGVIYARINKKGHKYHVFGTHTDAGNSSKDVSTRKIQFGIIREFIEEKIKPKDPRQKPEIKSNELVIIAGDLNVDKYYANSVEYNDMLRELYAVHPPFMGYPFSSDQNVNDLLPHAGKRELFDYVLISKSTQARLRRSYNQVLFFRADKVWVVSMLDKAKNKYFWDISDHYPVLGHFEMLPTPSTTPTATTKPSVKPTGKSLKKFPW
jgi:endonuclease/exonuclease/phosphatase family metal-dependent hydrolase/5-hydroxyisourate hydrolase-like protein (transthyretin family)